jgi:hypothetical protein
LVVIQKQFLAIVLVPVMLALLSFGCSGGETTVTVEKTVTVSGVRGSTPAEKEDYRKAINELTRRADQINTEFRALVDQYNNGQAKAEELAAKSEQNWRAYEEMSAQITTMKVPKEFQVAHLQLISGFNKWQSTFEAYRNGFKNNDANELARARDYDNQAVIEVNQAVSEISQVE